MHIILSLSKAVHSVNPTIMAEDAGKHYGTLHYTHATYTNRY